MNPGQCRSLPFVALMVFSLTGSRPCAAVEAPPGALLPAKFAQATADFAAGRFAECRVGFVSAGREALRAGLAARAYYGAACCAAQMGDGDAAFEALALAVGNGFRDVERALVDPRLDPMHTDPRWLGFLKAVEERRVSHRAAMNPTLLALAAQQEKDRVEKSAPAAALERRAAERRAQALEFVDKGRLQEPGDYFHAAALLAESDVLEEVARARALAWRALELDPDLLSARPVYAAALDRERFLSAKPQLFGTQLRFRNDRWELQEVEPTTTDADRAAWGLPTLAELQALATGLPAPRAAP